MSSLGVGMKDIVKELAKGLLAGLVGTAVMTLSETAEMRLTGREGSTVPGRVGAKLFGVRPTGDAAMARLNTRVHWGHGILMGSVRGVLSLSDPCNCPRRPVRASPRALDQGGMIYARWEKRRRLPPRRPAPVAPRPDRRDRGRPRRVARWLPPARRDRPDAERLSGPRSVPPPAPGSGCGPRDTPHGSGAYPIASNAAAVAAA